MSGKDFASKLAAGMRRAKDPTATTATAPAAPTPAPVATPPVSTRAASPLAPVRSGASPTDNPWTNLHPTRIWPD